MEEAPEIQEKKYNKTLVILFCGIIIAPFLMALFLNKCTDLSRKETVSYGYIVMRGKLLKHPYKIISDGENITVNGEWHGSENNLHVTTLNAWIRLKLGKSPFESSLFNSLVEDMKRGDLEIIFDKDRHGGISSGMPNVGDWRPQERVNNMNKMIKSDLAYEEKRQKTIEILDLTEIGYKYIDDILNNWNADGAADVDVSFSNSPTPTTITTTSTAVDPAPMNSSEELSAISAKQKTDSIKSTMLSVMSPSISCRNSGGTTKGIINSGKGGDALCSNSNGGNYIWPIIPYCGTNAGDTKWTIFNGDNDNWDITLTCKNFIVCNGPKNAICSNRSGCNFQGTCRQ